MCRHLQLPSVLSSIRLLGAHVEDGSGRSNRTDPCNLGFLCLIRLDSVKSVLFGGPSVAFGGWDLLGWDLGFEGRWEAVLVVSFDSGSRS